MNIRDKIRSIIFFTGFSTTLIFSVPAFAFDYNSDNETISATLDNIKQESLNFLNNHNQNYNLSPESQNETDFAIKIKNQTYYFTPDTTLSETDKTKLKNLINTGSSSLVETTENNAMFSIINTQDSSLNKYYKYDTTKLPSSSIAYNIGVPPVYDDEGNIVSTGDYDFKVSVIDNEGNKEDKYFKYSVSKSALSKITSILSSKVPTLTKQNEQNPNIPKSAFQYTNLNENKTDIKLIQENLVKNGNISLSTAQESDLDKITFNHPNGDKQYFKLDYETLLPTLTKQNEQNPNIPKSAFQYTNLNENKTNIKLIQENLVKNGNITFESTTESDLNKITFKLPNNNEQYLKYSVNEENYNDIYESRQTAVTSTDNKKLFKNITYSVSTSYNGSVLYNANALDTLNVDFVGNSTTSETGNLYGTFYNNNKAITNLNADFINNSITANNYANSAGLYNTGASAIIDNVTGDFINNSVLSFTREAQGGGLSIYNSTIKELNGNFINNSVNSQKTYATGGGIFNNKILNNIHGDFIGNTAHGYTYAVGGAILNTGTNAVINSITGDFIGNYIVGETTYANGGAIYNSGSIDDIIGNFISNSATGKTTSQGGAIRNSKTIGNIKGSFISNSANSDTSYSYGGAIYNENTIDSIDGNFIENSSNSTSANAQGGAIWNNKIINNIKGDFILNSLNSKTTAYGGAIYNNSANAAVDSIEGNFIQNSATSETKEVNGGAIFNSGTINNLISSFLKNSAKSNTTYANGGAVYNSKIIDSIKGDFLENSAQGKTSASGGAIYNYNGNAVIGSIIGDFINNSAVGETAGGNGGAIYNTNGSITSLAGDFIQNSSQGATSAYGGAIWNNKIITDIKGDFIRNSASAGTSYAYGGAIYSTSANAKIDNIIGDFIENSAISQTSRAYGGAIVNESSSVITNIIGNFLLNKTQTSGEAVGGGIYNSGTITFLMGDFASNSSTSTGGSASGGAIYNSKIINNIEGDFIENKIHSYKQAYGGAIRNNGASAVIDNITGDFIKNTIISETKEAYGGAISSSGIIGNITGDFINNLTFAKTGSYGGGITNTGTNAKIDSITGDFIANTVLSQTKEAQGGGLYNYSGTITSLTGDFIQNSVQGGTSASGGAIWNNKIITDIEGGFIQNSVNAGTSTAYGGAIYNAGGTITSLTGDFISNIATSESLNSLGGAIYNSKTINNITGDYTGNSVSAKTFAYGGGIYNTGANAIIDNIVGNFTSNSANSENKQAYGGAIYNTGTIENIEGDFNLNSANSVKAYAQGGAIYNNKIITNIEGNFISNSTKGKTYAEGGGIYNNTNGTIENIIGNFINNSTIGGTSTVGGSIMNGGTITNIEANFTNNSITAETFGLGGAIYNTGSIENLTGDFTSNSITSKTQAVGGGLFVNGTTTSHITNIESNFINNSATSLNSYARGGGHADYGYGSQNLTGDFIGNKAIAKTYAQGGGMHGITQNLIGNFINNSITAGTHGQGGGMRGYADNLTGNFTGNSIVAGTHGLGGGLYNSVTIKNLTGNYTDNVITAGAYAQGGGVYNTNTSIIENLIGDFIENSITADTFAQGGGIYNGYKLLSFKGDIINNYANSVLEEAQGGGIYNYAENAYDYFIQTYKSLDTSKIAKNIDEANIYASEKKEYQRQGLLTNAGMTEEEYNNKLATERQQAIDNINYTGYDSIEDWVQNNTSYSTLDEYLLKGLKKYRDMEEALHFNNYFSSVQERMEYLGYSSIDEMIAGLGYVDTIGTIEEFRGNIIGNSAISEKDIAQGGGLFNRGKAVIYDSDITFNTAKGAYAQGGGIYNGGEFAKLYLVADKKDLTFINNKTIKNDETQSNAIHNEAKVYLNTNKTVEDTSKNNNNTDGRIVIHDKISGNYADNNNSLPSFEINKPISEFLYSITENNETTDHNLVLNQTTGTVEFHNDIKGNDINLYNGNTIIVADNNDITLGNNLETITFKTNNAKLNINAFNNNSILANLKISQDTGAEASVDINKPDILITKTELNTKTNDSGEEEYTGTVKNTRYEISEEETRGNVIFNNDVNVKNVNMYNGELTLAHNITSQNVNLYGGTINMPDGINFNSNQYFNVYGGDLNLQNNTIGNTNLGNLVLNNELGLKTDIDFTHHKSDTITVNSLTNNGDYNINLKDIKVLNPVLAKSFNTSLIGDIQDEELKSRLASSVKYTGGDIVYSPIYKYGVSYDKETGKLTFARSGGSGEINTNPTYEEVNPAVMSSTVTRNTVAYATQANAYYEGFRSLNEMMYNTRVERFALKNKNKYALLNTKDEKIDSLLKSGIQADDEEKTGWFKAGSSIETISLKHGPKTDNTLYYSFVGFDSELREISKFKVLKGWDFMTGAYVGYNGGYQKFDGVSSTSNGLNIGTTLNLFKGNFFTGTTLGSGLMFSEASNMYGNESFKTLSTGIANKTGYNFEFKDGKYIIQPSLFISYSLFNTMDYTNASGVKIKSDALHLFTFEPGIKFIANLDNGWQPYVTLSFVDNIDLGGKVKAQDVVLPDVSVKPYVKYGVGVRKKWKDNISGFAQIYLTNGGRTGVGLQVGFNWLFDTRNMFVKNKDRNGDL